MEPKQLKVLARPVEGVLDNIKEELNDMKKKLINVLCFMLLVTLTSTMLPLSLQAEHDEFIYCNVIESFFGIKFASNYSRALDLINAFYENLPTSREGRTVYPENFGGFYINDNGELVVLYVGPRQKATDNVAMNVFNTDNANIREVNYTYADLREAFVFLDFFIPSNTNNSAAANVDGISFDIKSNNILVSLAIYCDDKILLFKETVLDASFLMFHKSPGLPSIGIGEEYANISKHIVESSEICINAFPTPFIRTGDALMLRDAFGNLRWSGSVGYRAVININGRGQEMGFVTAAHLGPIVLNRRIRAGDRIYNEHGQHVGTVQLTHLDTIDAAFFTLAPNAAGSNITARGSLMGRIEHVPIGGPVIFDGSAIGRGRLGAIRANWSGNLRDGPWVSGVRATYFTDPGDSGGVVYSWTNVSDNGVVGIHVASWWRLAEQRWPDDGNSVFTRASDHSLRIGHQLAPR